MLAGTLAKHFENPDVSAVRDLDLAQVLAGAAGIVNSMPMGMEKHPGSAVPAGPLRADLWVADIVYFPIERQLLRAARQPAAELWTAAGWWSTRRPERSRYSPVARLTAPACGSASRRLSSPEVVARRAQFNVSRILTEGSASDFSI